MFFRLFSFLPLTFSAGIATIFKEIHRKKKSGAIMIKNPHDKHRARLRKMFLECNPEKMPDHMILEFLLCYSIPRIDTNGIAHELINRFGGLENVLDADMEELLKVPGIGEHSALLLKTVPLLCARYAANKLRPRICFQSTQKAAEFFIEYYLSKSKETVSALLLDNAGGLICHTELHAGAVNSSSVNARKLAEIALGYNAASVILAHNHPSGDPTPSDADLYTTKHLMKAFSGIDLTLKAHIIVAGDKYVDAVKVVEDNARYEVRYMAFRADDPPPSLESTEPPQNERPTEPNDVTPKSAETQKSTKKESAPKKNCPIDSAAKDSSAPKRGGRKKKSVPVEEVPLVIPAIHFESWTSKLALPEKDPTMKPEPSPAAKPVKEERDQKPSAPKKPSPPKAPKKKSQRPLPVQNGPVITIPEAIKELENQKKEP
jgi:DNA repair protein RadC